jgi:DNA (cytosine-5)-methyltransferase 1
MMENVPGLEKDVRFKALIRSLRGAGYRIDWEILSLEKYGVPQRRRRLVMIGWRGEARPDLAMLPSTTPKTVRDLIHDLPRIPKVARPLRGYKTFRSSVVKARIEHVPHNGGSRRALPKSLTLKCHTKKRKKERGFKDVYGRMAWDEVAPTITGGCINPSKGRFLHPERNRAISLLEAARLQAFPLWYKFDISHGRYPIAEMIGEALPPRFAKVAGQFIADALSGTTAHK